MNEQTTKPNAWLAAIPAWWPMIAFAFGMLALAAQAYARIGDHEQRLTDLEKAQPAIARELRDVNVGLARLEGKIDTLTATRDEPGGRR